VLNVITIERRVVISGISKETGSEVFWDGSGHYTDSLIKAHHYRSKATAQSVLDNGIWRGVIKNELSNIELKEIKISYELV